jgi:cereblon
MEELRGRTVLDDGSIHLLPMLPEPGVVLVPGQTIPLMVFYPPTISMLRKLISTNGTFGVICVR